MNSDLINLASAEANILNDVRSRLSQVVPRANDPRLGIRNVIQDFDDIPFDDLWEAIARYSGGLDQFETAQLLARLYIRFGFKSAVLKVGQLQGGGFSHAVTLVAFSLEGKPLISIQDAYFNFCVTDGSGAPANYVDLFRKLRSGDKGDYVLAQERRYRQYLELNENGETTIRVHPWYWGDPSWMKWLESTTGIGDLVSCFLLPSALIELGEATACFSELVESLGQPLLVEMKASRETVIPELLVMIKGGNENIYSALNMHLDKLVGKISPFQAQRFIALKSFSYEAKCISAEDFSMFPPVAASENVAKLFEDNRALHLIRFVVIGRLSFDLQEALAKELAAIPKDLVRNFFSADPWLSNYILNWWEYARGEAYLESFPWNISLPIADICNARCTFCTSWLEGKELISLEQVDAFEPVIRMAHQFGLAGHGEPLVHPKLAQLLQRFEALLDKRAVAYLITNGIHLEQHVEGLIKARVRDFNISLNAASPEVHEIVMGLGKNGFEKVIVGIKALKARLSEEKLVHNINITIVVTAQNIQELPQFIELGIKLGATGVMLRSLAGQTGLPLGLNYHLLPAYLHPEFEEHMKRTEEAIARYRDVINIKADPSAWRTKVFDSATEQQITDSPPDVIDRKDALSNKKVREYYRDQDKFKKVEKGRHNPLALLDPDDGANPFHRHPRFNCRAPYQYLYINDFALNMVPCCYMANVPGFHNINYDGSYGFLEAWNSPAFSALRERLRNGPLYRMCRNCPAVY